MAAYKLSLTQPRSCARATRQQRWSLSIVRQWLVGLAAVLVLTACGGGGGGTDAAPGNDNAVPPPPPAVTEGTQINVTLSDSVPPAARAVSAILSGTEEQPIGQPITLANPEAHGDALVVAIDPAGSPRLLAFTGSDVALSTDTTATALVWIALGERLQGIPLRDRAAAIQGSNAYVVLRDSLETHLAAGGTLETLPELSDKVWAAVEQSGTATQPVGRSARAAAIPTSGLPYYPYGNGTRAIWLNDLPGSQNITFHNQSVLPWSISGPAFSQITQPRDISGPLGLGADPARATLSMAQTRDTRTQALLSLNQKLLFTLIDLAFNLDAKDISALTSCAATAAGYFTDEKLSALISGDSGYSALDYLRSLDVGELAGTLVLNCQIIPQAGGLAQTLLKKSLGFNILIKTLMLGPSLYDTGQLAYHIALRWNDEHKVEICKRDGLAVACATDFYVGSADITECSEISNYRSGCNFLSYNINVGSGANLALRVGSESLNLRLDQQYGCIGATAPVAASAGSQFSYHLASTFSGDAVTSTTTYTVTEVTEDTIRGTLAIQFPLIHYNGQPGTGTAKGVWSVSKTMTPFPKCLLPIRQDGINAQGQPYGGSTQSFFCPSYGDYWGCGYRPRSANARDTDWILP